MSVKLTKKVRKDIRKLAKLVAKEQNLPKSGYIREEREYKDKIVSYGVQGLTEKGIYKYLIKEYEAGIMKHSVILYLITVNLMKAKGELNESVV